MATKPEEKIKRGDIKPNLDLLRGAVAKKIAGQDGKPNRAKAQLLAWRMPWQMSAETVMRFADDTTKNPQPATVDALARVMGWRVWVIPNHVKVPKEAVPYFDQVDMNL